MWLSPLWHTMQKLYFTQASHSKLFGWKCTALKIEQKNCAGALKEKVKLCRANCSAPVEETKLRWLILLTTFSNVEVEQGKEEQLNNVCCMVGRHGGRALDWL